MLAKDSVFHSGDDEKIWQKFCGFLDLSLEEFMGIQEALLMEQLQLVADSPLGRSLLRGALPKSVDEFRRAVMLTTYDDYAPFIGECQEESLAIKPAFWGHTSGRGGSFKWVPYSDEALTRFGDGGIAGLLLATANGRGEVKVRPGSRFLFMLAPRPYMSGVSAWTLEERFKLRVIPPVEMSESLGFQERIGAGFKMALREGADIIGAVGTVLVKMGESFANQSRGMQLSPFMLHPKVLFRLLRGWIRAKMERRPMLPRDLWKVQGLACGGTDTSVFRDKVEYYWGRLPLESYGFTECAIVALQSWVRRGLIFYPYLGFFEFIPEEEWLKSKADKKYQPATVLLNELQPGKIYEIVMTSFHGMPFMRYRPGDLIKVTSLVEQETGVRIPQFEFHSRADGLIDLYSIVRLDERTLWQALLDAKIDYEAWTARKEYEASMPVLRLYMELRQSIDPRAVERLVHEHLRTISPMYEEAVSEMETNPVRVTTLASGTYARYYQERQKAGADLAQLKPAQMNVRDSVIDDLLRLSAV